ncbi:MAG: type II toxin-antitoxin system VapC family toxin [Richelia sp. SM2_1_7]|nr:type II toxin-antitoxin system VapC family toxin [Richelia sp. SM2_1_7]
MNQEKKRGDPTQYKVENTLGFMGKYQFGEPLLIDLSYYKANVYYGKGANKNYWRGTWTGKKGIKNKAQFLNSPRVQELAIREAFALNYRRLKDTLKQKGKSIYHFLGKKKTYKRQRQIKNNYNHSFWYFSRSAFTRTRWSSATVVK